MVEEGRDEHKLELWRERHERVQRALSYEPVGKVPLAFTGSAFAAISQGVPFSRFCTDADTAIEVTLDCMDELGDVDAASMTASGLLPCHLTNLWLSPVHLPGYELPDHSPWQEQDSADMSVEDYEIILSDGWEAFLAFFMPEVHNLELLERHDKWMAENLADTPRRYHERGYATLASAAATIPFEALCGARSMAEFFLDLYRMPDKVKAALDNAQPWCVERAIELTGICGASCCSIVAGRGASAMVPPRIWDEFVYPYIVDMVNELHARGIFCLLHLDDDWSRDLHRFLELPRRSCALAFDGSTDLRAAKRELGDHLAFLGDVPASLLVGGTPDEVHGYVTALIRDIGPSGLIVSPGCEIPHDASIENVKAMVSAAR